MKAVGNCQLVLRVHVENLVVKKTTVAEVLHCQVQHHQILHLQSHPLI